MLSIITPIYNGEKYLRECIESVLLQNFDEWELILINDGSTDNSLGICNEYAQNDDRIVVVDKINSGVSETRNMGIDLARGEYIMFLDSDDLIVPDALNKINHAIIRNKYPEILVWGFSVFGNTNMEDDFRLLNKHRQGFKREELLYHLLSLAEDDRFRGFVGRSAYKTTFLKNKNVRFLTSLRMSEDFKFLIDAVLHVDSVCVLNERLYQYRVNTASTTSKYNKHLYENLIWLSEWLSYSVCMQNPNLKKQVDEYCAEMYILILQNLCKTGNPYTLTERIRLALKIKQKHVFLEKIKLACKKRKALRPKRYIIYLLFRLHLEPIYILLYSIKVSRNEESRCKG